MSIMLWFLQMVKVCRSGLSHASSCTIHPKRWKSFSFFRASDNEEFPAATHYNKKYPSYQTGSNLKSQLLAFQKNFQSPFCPGQEVNLLAKPKHREVIHSFYAASNTCLLPILLTSALRVLVPLWAMHGTNLQKPPALELSNTASCTMQLRCGI